MNDANDALDIAKYFGRIDSNGNVQVLFSNDGTVVTRFDDYDYGGASSRMYPVGSSISCLHEHPEGIVLSPDDAQRIGLDVEELL